MKPDAILTGDIHLRDDTPLCRTDNYFEAQTESILFIRGLQKKYDGIPVLDAGDLFNKWRPSPYLLAWAIDNLPYIITVPGNHDIPYHNVVLLDRSGLNVLDAAEKIQISIDEYIFPEPPIVPKVLNLLICPFPWGAKMKKYEEREYPKLLWQQYPPRKVALAHTLVYKNENLWPGLQADKAIDLLRRTNFDLIVTAHNHKSFVVEYEGRLLVNPGSMMRMAADQENHKPCVFLWYAKTNTVEPVFLPIKEGVISREHIEIKQNHDKRMEAFVTHLKNKYEVGLSFESNLELFFNKNRTQKAVKNLIWEAVG